MFNKYGKRIATFTGVLLLVLAVGHGLNTIHRHTWKTTKSLRSTSGECYFELHECEECKTRCATMEFMRHTENANLEFVLRAMGE